MGIIRRDIQTPGQCCWSCRNRDRCTLRGRCINKHPLSANENAIYQECEDVGAGRPTFRTCMFCTTADRCRRNQSCPNG